MAWVKILVAPLTQANLAKSLAEFDLLTYNDHKRTLEIGKALLWELISRAASF